MSKYWKFKAELRCIQAMRSIGLLLRYNPKRLPQ